MKQLNSKKKTILLVILILLVGVSIYIFTYVSDYYHADNRAISALSSTSEYTVDNNDDFIIFTPRNNKSTTGLIIYPGAKIEPESYSVIASEVASKGFTTIIVKMPFNLAFFDANKADKVIANGSYRNKELGNCWTLLGGVFASDYAINNQDKIKGVIYLAAYPNNNASNASFKGLVIRGTEDNLTTIEDINKNRDKFPANTTFMYITGGNHYNVGDYGIQKGDNNSTISREEQQALTVMYIVEFLNSF